MKATGGASRTEMRVGVKANAVFFRPRGLPVPDAPWNAASEGRVQSEGHNLGS
jgi:hypothetical protein